MDDVKPGWMTTEFWLSVVGVVALVVLCLADKVDGTVAGPAIATATLGYAVSRGVAKKSPSPTVVNQIGPAQEQSAIKPPGS